MKRVNRKKELNKILEKLSGKEIEKRTFWAIRDKTNFLIAYTYHVVDTFGRGLPITNTLFPISQIARKNTKTDVYINTHKIILCKTKKEAENIIDGSWIIKEELVDYINQNYEQGISTKEMLEPIEVEVRYEYKQV